MACGRQFSGGREIKVDEIWRLYQQNKQTIQEISEITKFSVSTVKRRLNDVQVEWHQPVVKGSGTIHMDATYTGRNTGVMVALESQSGRLLYMKHIAHERVSDYLDAVNYIESNGYEILGIVIDGLKGLFSALSKYPLQMCQFHMVAIIRRKLTMNPQLPAGKELLDLAYKLRDMDKKSFTEAFSSWKQRWHSFLAEKSFNPETGKQFYTHKRLRSAMSSFSFYQGWLFTYEEVEGMQKTNNIEEGAFTDLKNNLRNHAGMTPEHRIRFVNGFFLAYGKTHNEKWEKTVKSSPDCIMRF